MKMKLPFNFAGSGGNGYHNYSDSPFEGDIDQIDRQDDGPELTVYNPEDDFTEYLWMENEEEFDKLEWQRLEEEELMEQCIENMLDDVLENEESEGNDCVLTVMWPHQAVDSQDICHIMSMLEVTSASIENSTLNPLAKEFVPSSMAH